MQRLWSRVLRHPADGRKQVQRPLLHRPPTGTTSGKASSEQRPRIVAVPDQLLLVISPGTAKTSRPSSSAKSAVMSAPLRPRASTTIVASESPAMIRFRAGKRRLF